MLNKIDNDEHTAEKEKKYKKTPDIFGCRSKKPFPKDLLS